jgi:murein L,D-transpeptidase YcbB/YkuD
MTRRRSRLPTWPIRLDFVAILVAVLMLGACAGPTHTSPDSMASPKLDDALRAKLADAQAAPADIDAPTLKLLQDFYRQHHFAPIWVAEDGLAPRGAALLTALGKAHDAGAPLDEPLLSAAVSQRQARATAALADLEIVLSAALLHAAINPAEPTSAALQPELLPTAAGAADIAGFLSRRLPPDPGFWRLRAAVPGYRAIAATGGWPSVPTGPKLELGGRDPRVAALRARLTASGDFLGVTAEPDLFDPALKTAVERFQARHGLKSDGVVGNDTVAALNVPAAVRLATILANLHRLTDAPRDWGSSYLVVNTAAASYRVVEEDHTVIEQVAIVGQPTWQTPDIDSAIERLEFNPYWTVPPRIARLELGPKATSDSAYLQREGIRKVNGLYRQRPGPRNVLGRAKFLFDNSYDVYLHDTNSPGLFERTERHLSHGCVRLPNALALAAYLLRNDPTWPRTTIDEAVARGRNRGATLMRPLPVHLVYDTAWVGLDGTVQFRNDVYGRDGRTEIAAAN